jgi:beta-N-acetylhexosaminidase
MRDLGFTVDFAPDADVTIGPADVTIRTRSASSDPERAARAVLAASSGLTAGGEIPVLKHFPGHGSAKQNSHDTLASVSLPLTTLAARDFVPFEQAIDNGAPAIMMGHLLVKEWGNLPSTVNPEAYEYLRDTLGFDGVVFTDALNMEGVTDIYPPGKVEARALEAGADALLFPANVAKAVKGIRAALDSGVLPRERLDEAVARVTLLAEGTPAAGASQSASTVNYSAAAAVVAAKDCSALVHGTVGLSGGTAFQRARLSQDLTDAGLTVVKADSADTTVALLPYDRAGAKADVVVALNGPWALANSSADTYVAIWGRAGSQMDALARVLTEPGTAKGTWPVKVNVPYEVCE